MTCTEGPCKSFEGSMPIGGDNTFTWGPQAGYTLGNVQIGLLVVSIIMSLVASSAMSSILKINKTTPDAIPVAPAPYNVYA